MPLGLPPHLATRTTVTAVARAGHVAAAACLVGVGLVVLSIQAYLPQTILWPAIVVLIPMMILLAMLERNPSHFVAASYLVVGALCVLWFSLIVSTQLGTPLANDEYTIVLLKISLILAIGMGSGFGASILWSTVGFALGELASIAALVWLGGFWQFDVVAFTAWLVVVGLLAVQSTDRVTGRDSQSELYRAARDEMFADVRRVFESRATALLHDTVLNQLAVITTGQATLSPAARAAIRADLETMVGQEWFDVDTPNRTPDDITSNDITPTDITSNDITPTDSARVDNARVDNGQHRLGRLRASIDDAAAGAVTVEISGDRAVLDGLDGESFDEFTRAIGQCIANVRRHAGTDTADVILGGTADEVSAMVIDAGKGFALDAHTDGRLGVATSIVGRLETIGGSARVWSQPDNGTSVLLRVPRVDRQSAAEVTT